MKISKEAEYVLSRLCESGFEAYAVGGCVRDIIRDIPPHDYDITTSALPSEIKKIFSEHRTVDIGISHGTVGVIINGENIEITTFRKDGEYKDSRHPESVLFTSSIKEDLSRRDLTVNSIAMDINGRLIDPFGGKRDIEQKIIRCTGDASKRFGEDALRIMRALRFSSCLGFEIEKETAKAIHEKSSLLLNISAERIFTELKKLLCGKNVFRILTEYSDVICTVIPELSNSVGFEHKSKYHIYDVYTHTAKAVEAAECNETVRLAMLFHDIGKPFCFTEEDGVRHFRGHPKVSENIARTALKRLKCDRATLDRVCMLCRMHDNIIEPTEKNVRKLFSHMSIEDIELLCYVKKADSAAHAPTARMRGKEADSILTLAKKIQNEKQCVTVKGLAVDGSDMISIGLKGKDIGDMLKTLLSFVISDKLPNERDALLKKAKEMNREI